MDKNIDINEIRDLLTRFYEGATSRAEERRLGTLLSDAEALPPDLLADRELFQALTGEADDVEMPEEFEARITGAVEGEMKHSRRLGVWRRGLAIAGTAAAALLMVWLVGSMVLNDPDPATVKGGGMANVPKTERKEGQAPVTGTEQGQDTTLIVQSIQLANAVQPKKGVGRRAAPRVEECDEEPEAEYVASSRRVVEDPDEAAAIIGSVFARLDDNMREEQFLIEEINDQYEIMSCKLCY